MRGFRKDEIANNLRSDMGSENTQKLPSTSSARAAWWISLWASIWRTYAGWERWCRRKRYAPRFESIYRYNYKRSLAQHDNVQRTFALNDEASVVICDYGKAERPHIPFPYFAETMTGFEYTAAVLMMNWGMVDEGVECVRNMRARYDGEKRNPWDEAECGHHYARAMASWSAVRCAERIQL